jgi:hypothetical protein
LLEKNKKLADTKAKETPKKSKAKLEEIEEKKQEDDSLVPPQEEEKSQVTQSESQLSSSEMNSNGG